VPSQLEHIVVALCTNAWESIGDDGGEIQITLAPAIPPGPSTEDHPVTFARITVHDNGEGIPQEILPRVSDPYFTTKKEHSGIGLTVVNGIVAAHNGQIRLESEVGFGTTVSIYLPTSSPKGISQEVPHLTAIPGGQEHILLVDDEPQIIRMHSIILTRMGYEVTSFTSSVDALNAFMENPGAYDLVLTDMTMPKLNGDALARTIRAASPSTPIILCTGYSEQLEHNNTQPVHVDRIIGKPTDKKTLSTVIRELLDQRHKGE
ncbi:response regulator, partial [Myxococcota bacterium]|nr:response regulator [Myxococcota bacterium]